MSANTPSRRIQLKPAIQSPRQMVPCAHGAPVGHLPFLRDRQAGNFIHDRNEGLDARRGIAAQTRPARTICNDKIKMAPACILRLKSAASQGPGHRHRSLFRGANVKPQGAQMGGKGRVVRCRRWEIVRHRVAGNTAMSTRFVASRRSPARSSKCKASSCCPPSDARSASSPAVWAVASGDVAGTGTRQTDHPCAKRTRVRKVLPRPGDGKPHKKWITRPARVVRQRGHDH